MTCGNLRTVNPFLSTLRAKRVFILVQINIEFDNETTAIDEVLLSSGTGEAIIEVFSLGGQRLAKLQKGEFENFWQTLPAGVYIVNGKIVIK